MNINGVEQIPIVSLYQINKFVSNKIVKKKILNEFTMTLKKDEFLLINYKDPQEIIAFNNIISGIDNDYSGHTYLLGAYLPALNNSQRAFLRANLLGFIFRENKFFENYTVFENLLYSFSYKNYNINKIKDKIIKLVLYIGIERYLNKKIKEIPIDLLIKVAFIRVLIKKPALIIANYSSNHVQEKKLMLFIEALLKIHHDFNISIILTTDYFIKISDIKSQYVLIDGGLINYENHFI